MEYDPTIKLFVLSPDNLEFECATPLAPENGMQNTFNYAVLEAEGSTSATSTLVKSAPSMIVSCEVYDKNELLFQKSITITEKTTARYLIEEVNEDLNLGVFIDRKEVAEMDFVYPLLVNKAIDKCKVVLKPSSTQRHQPGPKLALPLPLVTTPPMALKKKPSVTFASEPRICDNLSKNTTLSEPSKANRPLQSLLAKEIIAKGDSRLQTSGPPSVKGKLSPPHDSEHAHSRSTGMKPVPPSLLAATSAIGGSSSPSLTAPTKPLFGQPASNLPMVPGSKLSSTKSVERKTVDKSITPITLNSSSLETVAGHPSELQARASPASLAKDAYSQEHLLGKRAPAPFARPKKSTTSFQANITPTARVENSASYSGGTEDPILDLKHKNKGSEENTFDWEELEGAFNQDLNKNRERKTDDIDNFDKFFQEFL
jgi:hypothetical protein